MQYCAHRGLSSQAPENTLAAIRLAASKGLKQVEIDVQLTRDKAVVVMHDDTVQRCSNGQGPLADLDYNQLQTMDAGSWFSADYVGERVPLLAEVLSVAKDVNLTLNIELKLYPQRDVLALCEAVAEQLQQSGLEAHQILLSSFNIDALAHMQRLVPEYRRGCLWEQLPEDYLVQLQRVAAYSAHLSQQGLRAQQVAKLNEAGYPVQVYTVNDLVIAETLAEWGVAVVISDCADRLQEGA